MTDTSLMQKGSCERRALETLSYAFEMIQKMVLAASPEYLS